MELTLNCFVYSGQKDVLCICDMEVVDKLPAAELVCKITQQEEGNWKFLVHSSDRARFNKLLKKFNDRIYLRMPDGQGYSLTY